MKRAMIYLGLVLAAPIAPVGATVTVKATPVTPSQVGTTSQARVGLAVRGETSGKVLTVGGGYTLTCVGQTSGSIEAQRSVSQTNLVFPKIVLDVMIPETIPTEYVIQGWSSWAGGSVHECQFKYRGSAIEGATGITGGGYGFTFGITSGALESTDAQTAQFVMIKPVPRPGGCDPQCTCTP